MEKERKIKTLSLVALIVAVLGLTVAFASLSQTLNITGTAKVENASWDIHFQNLSEPTLTGDANVTTAPTIDESKTTIGNYEVSLTKPGDKVSYSFEVINNGTIDAKLSTLTKALKPTCTSDVEADATTVCDGLTYTLKYADGGAEVAANDTLNKGETKGLILELAYESDSVPANDVAISGLNITLTYEQK